MTELWDKLCEQAANKAGISLDELKRKLESDEAYLEIKATLDAEQHKE